MGRGRTNITAARPPRSTISGHWDEIARRLPISTPARERMAAGDLQRLMVEILGELTVEGALHGNQGELNGRLADVLQRHLRLDYPDLADTRDFLGLKAVSDTEAWAGMQSKILDGIPAVLKLIPGSGKTNMQVGLELRDMARTTLMSDLVRRVSLELLACRAGDLHAQVSRHLYPGDAAWLDDRCRELGRGGLSDALSAITPSTLGALYADMLLDGEWMHPVPNDGPFRDNFRRRFSLVLRDSLERGGGTFIPASPPIA